MKLGERKVIALGDDVAVIYECSNKGVPRLTIHNGHYAEEGILYPATTTMLYGQSVRDLYDMLHEYYTESREEKENERKIKA